MKIINKRKFVTSITLIILLVLIILIIISKCTLSKTNVNYTETYIEVGDTLWNIAKYQQGNNNYYKDKEIREIISDIKKINNLQKSDLFIGQKIIIPVI